MASNTIPEWDAFYESTQGRPPRQELLKALPYVTHKGKALDIGAGALNETRYLLSQGFEVTSIDSEPAAAKGAAAIASNKLHFYPLSYEKFSFPEQVYDLVVALYALPFTPSGYFKEVVNNALSSLKPGGVFVGQLFGEDDEWNDGKSHVNFVSEAEAKAFFDGFEILGWEEEKGPGRTSTGGTKYWHIYHIIARR